MSSKVILPEEDQPSSPLIWRRVKAEPPKPADEARHEFQEQIARLEQQFEQRMRDAHAAGMHEGEAAGRSHAAAEIQPLIERLSRTIDELAQLRPRLRKDAEGDTIQLSLAIARRVLRRELAIDPEALHGLVLAALEKLQAQEVSRVRVHPAQAAAVTACLSRSPTGHQIEVISDPARDPGAVVFETSRGNLDASVESQLQEIERGLTDRLRRNA